MKIFQRLLILVAMLFASNVFALELQLAKPHVTTGARGLTLSAPSVVPSRSRLKPLDAFFKPGETMAPVIIDVIPCAAKKCNQPFATRLMVRVMRLKQPDENGDPESESALIARATSRIELMRHQSREILKLLGKTHGEVIENSFQIVELSGRKWAKVRCADEKGRETGSFYWSVLTSEYTLFANFVANPDLMPHDISVAEIEAWFEGYLREVKASGRPE